MTLPLLAATGFTQISWFLKLGLLWAAVIYMFSRVILSWKVWSWKPVLLAAVLALGVGLLFTPWSSLTEIKSNDPDVLSWHRRFYVTAIAWMFAAGASVLRDRLAPGHSGQEHHGSHGHRGGHRVRPCRQELRRLA